MRLSLSFVCAAACLSLVAQPLVRVTPDRPPAVYSVGETVTFSIEGHDERGERLAEGRFTVTLDDFGTNVVRAAQVLDFKQGNPLRLTGCLDTPGFLRLTLAMADVTNLVTSVAVSPTRIRASEPCPKDFDDFWCEAIAAYDRTVPNDIALDPLPALSTDRFDAFKVSLSTPTRRKIYGVLARPKGGTKGPFPLWCAGKGAGPASMDCCGREGRVVLEMNVHYYEAPPGRTKRENAGLQTIEDAEWMTRFPTARPGYLNAGLASTNKADYFLYDAILATRRAIDWIAQQPWIDRSDIVYASTSQGGAFGLYMAALCPIFRKVAVFVPAFADQCGLGRVSGLLRLIEAQLLENRRRAEANMPYFDTVNFAARVRCPIRFVVGFSDEVCPPACVYAAYNAVTVDDRAILHGLNMTHSVSRALYEQVEMWLKAKAPGEPFDVRRFGAVGDGVHDDTAALQRLADRYHATRPKSAPCVTRHVTSMFDQPFPAVVFPKGVYRVSGPVVFEKGVRLVGEPGARIVNVTPTAETFYFRHGFRVMVEGLSFYGGACHLRHWTNNRDMSFLHVADCRFENASSVAVVSDSFRGYTTNAVDATHRARLPLCESCEVRRDTDGGHSIMPRDERFMVPFNNSTQIIVERCRFEGNACAFRGYSDGVSVRGCSFRAPSESVRPQLRLGAYGVLGSEVFLSDIDIVYSGVVPGSAAAIRYDGGKLSLRDVRLSSDSGLSLVRSTCTAGDYGSPSSLWLERISLRTGFAPVVSFLGDTFPNRLVAISIVNADGCHKRLCQFDREPTGASLEALLKRRMLVGLQSQIGVVLDATLASALDVSLPAALRPCVRPYASSLHRDFGARGGETFVEALPQGAVFMDATIGRDSREEEGDDTEKVLRLIELARAAHGGIVRLPGKWVRVSRSLPVPDGTRIMCLGQAAIEMTDADAPLFVIDEGAADVAFERILMIDGRSAVQVTGERGRARLIDCGLYGQKGPSLQAEARVPGQFALEMTGGTSYTPYLYAGNARFTVDSHWYEECAERPKGEIRPQYAAIVNLPGGELRLKELLGVPCYFQHYPKHEVYGPNVNPAPERIGDFRWIDNHGLLISRDVRYGGEWGGLTPVYHFGAAETYVESGVVELSCQWLRAGRACVVADSDEANITLVDVLTNFPRETAEARRQVDGRWQEVKSARSANNYLFK